MISATKDILQGLWAPRKYFLILSIQLRKYV